MRKATCSAALAVMLSTGTVSAAVTFELGEPPTELAPGESFSLAVTLVQSDPAARAAAMRLHADSGGVLTLTGATMLGPHENIRVVAHDPLDPYSEFLSLKSPVLSEPPPAWVMTVDLLVDSQAQPGYYTLGLVDVRVFDSDFADLFAAGDEITLQIVPEPACFALLVLGLCARRRPGS